jgi:PAS domain S-box-containing protein
MTAAPEQSAELSLLVRTLGTADQQLEQLTEGEIDSVVDGSGRLFVLRHAQEQLRDADAARRAAILDALPAQIALLDASGFIIAVNSTWRRFSELPGYRDRLHGPGQDYIASCECAQGFGHAATREVAAGIRAVLGGDAKCFEIEYRCGALVAPEWFLLSVHPVEGEGQRGAVLMHQDITRRKCQEEDLQRFASGLDAAEDAICLVDRRSMRYIHVNDSACRLHGRTRERLMALGPADTVGRSSAELEREYDALIADAGVPQSLESQRRDASGAMRWLEVRRHAHYFGDRWTIVVMLRDITERKPEALSKISPALLAKSRPSRAVLAKSSPP